eukprot:TRINITY_DN15550_c0_g1_i1.p1 TRINITY_DN15550_c0_g1~~TRINITY_DN15550_c0_g1_i1.p1  ORF type:complete len:377 (+),score=82.76 TRINITY_DN15550_c0_g1_i1:396-1526(+)
MGSQYWIVSLPLKGTKEAAWSAAQEKISHTSFDTQIYKFHIPELRVGTLDSLLALSDDLVKVSSTVENIAGKIRRQLDDLDRTGGNEVTALSVDGIPVDSYITRFQWDEAKYPIMSPLREIMTSITDSVVKLEDDLKIRVSEYNAVKSQLSQINRKATGSLAVKDLSSIVKPEDIVTSEHLVTLLVVVSRFTEKEWLTSYEGLSQFVVPRSSTKLAEDNEYALYTVVLFKKVADTFKTHSREKGFQVREFDFDPENHGQREEQLEKLQADMDGMRISLQQWCAASYGEVFSGWLHMCAIRTFAESILRYGLPPAFLSVVIIPSLKSEKRLRQALDQLAGGDKSSHWKSGGAEDVVPGLVMDTDLYPYVSLTLNLAT